MKRPRSLPSVLQRRLIGATVAAWWMLPALLVAAPPPLTAPSDDSIREGREIVAAMKASERGPFSRIRWYCNDGSVQPPSPYACAERGGGRQHGEHSTARQRLLELGWPAGTVLAATSFEELRDAAPRQTRLRDLVLERYLVEADDGWVLRGARTYRGAFQVEDEEEAGRQLLLAALAEDAFVRQDFLLLRELVRTVPHHGGSDRTRTARRLAQEVAEAERSFEPLRIRIHSVPGAGDVDATVGWLASARASGADRAVLAKAEELVTALRALYQDDGRVVADARKELGRRPAWESIDQAIVAAEREPDPSRRVASLSGLLLRTRELALAAPEARFRLAWLDLSLGLETRLGRAVSVLLAGRQRGRGDVLETAVSLLDAAYGSGLLSDHERGALREPALRALRSAEAADYRVATAELSRAAAWGMTAVRWSFAEPLVRYGALEPKAHRFVDDLLRSSPLLPLSELSAALAADAEEVSGRAHRVLGANRSGVFGLNPGLALGPLVVWSGDEAAKPGRADVVLLAKTVSELPPVAGILTLEEGNLLSHVQMLARNLGIPNASVSRQVADEISRLAGQRLLLAVSSDGAVVVARDHELSDELLAALGKPAAQPRAATGKVEAPVPDLSVCRPLPLSELRADLAGRVVGPKAANLGELAYLFPGRVAPAIALPFGIFAEHVSRGEGSPKQRLDDAHRRFRAGELDAAALAAEVEAVRTAVAAVTLAPSLRAELEPMMLRLFGPESGEGIFVRSDTNVEDLPGFTGAGLNETVPNVVGRSQQLAAIPRVWASPFRERPMAWRSTLLLRPEEVYTSVLLMKSVPSDKSGVLVTRDLVNRRDGLTVAMAWGVGGAVDGEVAETLVLQPDGGVQLVSEAKSPYRRRLAAAGGVEWVPAPSGPVLTVAEQRALRSLAAEVGAKLQPVIGDDGLPLPWDVELGFVDGVLALFQIRPLVERGPWAADRVVRQLLPIVVGRPSSFSLGTPVRIRAVGGGG